MIKRHFEIEGTNQTIDITRCEQDLAFTINEGPIKSQSEFVKRIQLLEIGERGAGRDRGGGAPEAVGGAPSFPADLERGAALLAGAGVVRPMAAAAPRESAQDQPLAGRVVLT